MGVAIAGLESSIRGRRYEEVEEGGQSYEEVRDGSIGRRHTERVLTNHRLLMTVD